MVVTQFLLQQSLLQSMPVLQVVLAMFAQGCCSVCVVGMTLSCAMLHTGLQTMPMATVDQLCVQLAEVPNLPYRGSS